MSRPQPPARSEYRVFYPITTRWADNDLYGHINNVVYYSYFDTAANRFLIEEGGLDPHSSSIVGFVVSSGCEYHAPVAYPEP
ncbi:MAG: acyl-CoA thioesterase, partial [Acidobacteriota bacterium]